MKEAALKQVVSSGIGFLHENMTGSDWDCVTNLYRDGILRVLVCPFDLCWKLRESSHLVVIMGTETYDGKERRYIDYPISDLLHMMGKEVDRPSIQVELASFFVTPQRRIT